MAPLGAKSASPYLDLRGAKLRGRAKMVFSVAISEIRWAESVPSETVLALVIQNGPTWAKSALKKLGPIWLLGPIRLFPFYSAPSWLQAARIRIQPSRITVVNYLKFPTRGGSVIFVPKGGGGPSVFYQPRFQMLRPPSHTFLSVP